MVAIPADLDVITIFPQFIATTATELLLELTDVPTRPSVAASLAVLLSVDATKVTVGIYFVIV
jgi:hypothetical protein